MKGQAVLHMIHLVIITMEKYKVLGGYLVKKIML
jgi:hypothetical protein